MAGKQRLAVPQSRFKRQMGCSSLTPPCKSVAVAVYTYIQTWTIEKWNLGV